MRDNVIYRPSTSALHPGLESRSESEQTDRVGVMEPTTTRRYSVVPIERVVFPHSARCIGVPIVHSTEGGPIQS